MIYAILSVKKKSGKLDALLATLKGISGASLYAVVYEGIIAVVSDIEKSDLITDRSNAIEYASIIESLVQQFPLLPMCYGSLMESTDAIAEMLGRNYTELRQNLKKVENMREYGLKIFCDPEKLKSEFQAISKNDINILIEPSTEVKNSVYREYVRNKLKEHRLEESIMTYVNSVIAEISGCLARLNAVCKFKKMPSATIMVDAVFLLRKDKKDELLKVVNDLKNQYQKLNFVLTGPWPPYNFVDTRIK